MNISRAIANVQDQIFNKCIKDLNASSSLIACGSCGIKSFQCGNVEHEKYSLNNLNILLYNDEQIVELNNISDRYKKVIIFYEFNERIYH